MKRILTLLSLYSFSAMALVSSIRPGTQQVLPNLAKAGLPSYFVNPSCEKNDTSGITDANNIVTRVSSGGLGDLGTDCQIDAATSGHLASFQWRTYPNRLEGANCEVVGYYKGDASLYKVDVVQNSVVLNSLQLANSTNGQEYSIQFPCGSDNSQAITVEIEATGNAAAAFNHVFLHGGEYQTYQVAQASQWGYLRYDGGTNRSWSYNTSFGDPAADPDFAAPTVSGGCTAPGTRIPQCVANNMPAGNYRITAQVAINSSGTDINSCRIFDGTNAIGTKIVKNNNGTAQAISLVIEGVQTYTTVANRTFTLQCEVTAGTTTTYTDRTNANFEIFIDRFPTASEQVLKIGAPGSEWTAFTPTNTQGFGTITSANFQYVCADGPSIIVRGQFTSGTVSGSIAQLGIPTGFTVGPSSAGRFSVGALTREAAAGPYGVFAVPGNTYVTFGAGTTSQGDVTGSSLVGSTEALLIEYQVPVTASSPCPPPRMPLVKQAVTTSSEGVERVERAVVRCFSTSAINSQSGDWLSSIGNVSSGACALTFKTGVFSAAPTCTISVAQALGAFTVGPQVQVSSATAGSVGCTFLNTGSSTVNNCTDTTYHIHCVGPR